MNKLALAFAAALLAAPLAARADIGLRVGGAADILYNNNDTTGTHFITSNWPIELSGMLSWWTPGSLVSLDAEIAEQFQGSGSGSGRVGTVLRPGVRISPPVLPFYVRGAIPINVEVANCPSGVTCRETFDLRLGAGITIPLVLFKVYIEADADFPLSSNSGNVSAFNTWNVWLNGGLDFRF